MKLGRIKERKNIWKNQERKGQEKEKEDYRENGSKNIIEERKGRRKYNEGRRRKERNMKRKPKYKEERTKYKEERRERRKYKGERRWETRNYNDKRRGRIICKEGKKEEGEGTIREKEGKKEGNIKRTE